MTPELETLDQLIGGEMPLAVIRALFADSETFANGIQGLLAAGDVRLLDESGELPQWRWRDIFTARNEDDFRGLRLQITNQGARQVS